MLASPSRSPALRPLHRFLAAGAAALVLVLTILAVSPQLHAALHHHGHDHGPATESTRIDDGCVISLFAGGVTAAPAPLALSAPRAAHVTVTFEPRAEIFVSPPRYLHQPERGPPLS